ncbi:Hypothetical_protein [Hexamita inflata]|uniref:Hypothetical_protein n=1 Tax=Hexamita inflata TaxID=28002 RepID=A0AA86N6I8_9EUKA|nr:Hypothetical protein HINF_LOCUS1400 [Hexamita inflata]
MNFKALQAIEQAPSCQLINLISINSFLQRFKDVYSILILISCNFHVSLCCNRRRVVSVNVVDQITKHHFPELRLTSQFFIHKSFTPLRLRFTLQSRCQQNLNVLPNTNHFRLSTS